MKVTKRILITIDGKERELTDKEAKALYDQLGKALDKPDVIQIPVPAPPEPRRPRHPIDPWTRPDYWREDFLQQFGTRC